MLSRFRLGLGTMIYLSANRGSYALLPGQLYDASQQGANNRKAGLNTRTSYSHREQILHMSAGSGMAAKTVLVPIADGSEEIEAVTIIDTLVRAGAKVVTASVGPNIQVTCSRGVKITADVLIDAIREQEFDLIACPGGMPGATHLHESSVLTALLTEQNKKGRLVAAICASPAVVLAPLGILNDRLATCYPAEKFIAALPKPSDDNVVVTENLITSRGPGTSLQFSLKLVGLLYGEETERQIAAQMLA